MPVRRVPQAVLRLVELYDRERRPDEAPEAFLARVEPASVKALLADLEKLDAADAVPDDFVDLGEEKQFEVKLSEGECAA